MSKFRLLLLLSCVLVFTGCAQLKQPNYSKAPQVNMPGMPDKVTAAAICHHYSDTSSFNRKLAKIKLIVNEKQRNSQTQYLHLQLYGECIVNLQGVLNDYKNSI